jgi:hypothetical protein
MSRSYRGQEEARKANHPMVVDDEYSFNHGVAPSAKTNTTFAEIVPQLIKNLYRVLLPSSC